MAPENIRRKAYEKYYDIFVDDGWYAVVYEDYTERLKEVGFEVGDIQFSGFWCQGDGASITGSVSDLGLFIDTVDFGKYPLIRTHYQHPAACSSVRISRGDSRYSHEHTLEISSEIDFHTVCNYGSDDVFKQAVATAFLSAVDGEVRSFEDVALDYIKAVSRECYRSLEAEYKYLTSEEVVMEWVDENWERLKEDFDPEDIDLEGELD